MVRFARIVFAVLLLAVCLCSCGREGRVIPKSKMSKIYAELFLADAWLITAPFEAKGKADTMAFYEPIFEKYGYTVEDYWASVSYYLQDPDRFSRILNKSNVILETEFGVIEKQRLDAIESDKQKERVKPRLFHSVYGSDGTVIDLDSPKIPKPLKEQEL